MNDIKQAIAEALIKGSVDIIQAPIADIKSAFMAEGWTFRNDEDCINGWQVDFWYYFIKEDQKILLSGSLWYGNYKLTYDVHS